MAVSALFFFLVFLINLTKFFGLDLSPPGFYIDEAVGAVQAYCLKQTGYDAFGEFLPFFARGGGYGAGYYTAPYLYGEVIWTSIFGSSIVAYRSFVAMITLLTLLGLYRWLKKEFDEETARFGLLLGSVSPWVFQFSRIAWDPPLAPLFMVMALNAFSSCRKRAWILGVLLLSLAAHAYPPCRITCVFLIFLFPRLNLRRRMEAFAGFLVLSIPYAFRAFNDPAFLVRSKMLVISSDHPMNPYRDENIFGLSLAVLKQMTEYFTPSYLFQVGDHNLRHSTGSFGILGWAEALLLILGISVGIRRIFDRDREFLTGLKSEKVRLIAGMIFAGILPAALTWESNPHALRSLAAWPFVITAFACCARALQSRVPHLTKMVYVAALSFFIYFAYGYFENYPERARAWFTVENNVYAKAYEPLVSGELKCEQIRF